MSKFSKVSVFSGLNNLTDITIDDKFANLLGYTQEELEYYFEENIKLLANKFNIQKEKLLYEIRRWYNGYSWNGKDFLYNPYSILSLFLKQEFNNYWFATGTPTFLIKLIKEKNVDIKEFDNLEKLSSLLESFEIDNIDIYSLLFQTGYLTIKKVIQEDFTRKKYILSYPNLEVKESFLNNILKSFVENSNSDVLIWHIKDEIERNNLDKVFEIIKSIYASIPNQIFMKDKESYYHTIFYLILSLLGTRIEVEINTNIGRIDGVIHTKERIYIVEFKIGKAEEGLKQIEENKYYEKYLSLNKKIVLIGIGFNKRKKNIDKYVCKELG
ncbi:MAG: hypothetical protein KatS3mg068_2117 [Candidatus Sericytochromatia bacterium]|nr:MAG: hypothetical protein KatS3mg068_2117 [Candidatus Sericytochromatia bacterium]